MLTKVIAGSFLLLSFVLALTSAEQTTTYRFYEQKSSDDVPTCTKQTVIVKEEGNPSSGQVDDEAIKKIIAEVLNATIRLGFQRLDDGWIALFNGYQYKLSNTTHSYESGQTYCQSIGGDLAVFGIQDLGNRRIIKNALNIVRNVFIGLDKINDDAHDDRWKYIDGTEASDNMALWANHEPDVGNNCGLMLHSNLLTYSIACVGKWLSLCEKRWN